METESETKIEAQAETETETETQTETQTETEKENKTETETQTETETETETETKTVTQLPRFIVIKVSTGRYVNYREDGPFFSNEMSVFSPLVKIEAERSQTNPNSGRVHLRFCHSNRYWRRRNNQSVLAEATEPEEDVSSPLCTLFSFEDRGTNFAGVPVFNIVHVHTGRRLTAQTRSFNVTSSQSSTAFEITNWSTLVYLPPRVAFKGYNDKYLRAVIQDRFYNYHKFESDDPNERQSGYEVFPMNDGHVRIRSDHWGMFWRRSPNWIFGDAPANAINNRDTLFWPFSIDNSTIALRNAGNDNFCIALNADTKVDCLNAGSSTITNRARLVVEELVEERKIYNIWYRMEHARIFNESPFLAGSSSVANNSDQEASMAVEIEYTDEVSNSFSNSISVTAGMTNTFEGGIPFIFSAKIEVSMQGSYTREWGQTVTTRQTIKASGSVPVPPRSVALVNYIGARGTCNVPFSYTQQDKSSTSGAITETEKIDGIFEGVNSYNFQFVVQSTRSL